MLFSLTTKSCARSLCLLTIGHWQLAHISAQSRKTAALSCRFDAATGSGRQLRPLSSSLCFIILLPALTHFDGNRKRAPCRISFAFGVDSRRAAFRRRHFYQQPPLVDTLKCPPQPRPRPRIPFRDEKAILAAFWIVYAARALTFIP